MQNHSVYIVNSDDGSILFNSSAVEEEEATATAPVDAPRVSEWEGYAETGSYQFQSSNKDGPVEQLHLTGGFTTDYLWYETTIASADAYKVTVTAGLGTVLYTYVDGKLLDPSPPDSVQEGEQYVASGVVGGGAATRTRGGAEPETVTLQLLSVAMGLSNGGVGPGSRKGIYAAGPLSNNSNCRVHVNGEDVTSRPWQMKWLNTVRLCTSHFMSKPQPTFKCYSC